MLKIYGNDNVINYLEFKVDNLTNEAIEEEFILPPSALISDMNVDEYLSSTSVIEQINYEEEIISGDNNIGIALIIVIFFLVSSLVIPIKKKKVGKND